jgi:hypothetical protein
MTKVKKRAPLEPSPYRKIMLTPDKWPEWPFLYLMNSSLKRMGLLYYCEETGHYFFAVLTLTGLHGADFERTTPDTLIEAGWSIIRTTRKK